MADDFTAHYNFTKPEVNSSRDTWGGKNNVNLDTIDGLIYGLENNKLNDSGTKLVEGDTVFRIIPVVQPVDPGPVSSLITADVLTLLFNTMFPIYSIIIWAGTLATIPANWRLCDGTNGTPNLVGRFVRGGNGAADYELGAVGGADTHNHTVAGHALTVAQLPAHAHPASDSGHKHGYLVSGSNPATKTIASGSAISRNNEAALSDYGYANITVGNTGSNEAHAHTLDAQNHRPPYMNLCYIMRVV